MGWGHGAVQRAFLAELRRQQAAIDTISLIAVICGSRHYTYAQAQSARRALRTLAAEGIIVRHRSRDGSALWAITPRR